MKPTRAKLQRVSCPSCSTPFECKPCLIYQCQSFQVELSEKENEYIRNQYEDCLCEACLLALKKEYRHRKKRKVLDYLKTNYVKFVKNH